MCRECDRARVWLGQPVYVSMAGVPNMARIKETIREYKQGCGSDVIKQRIAELEIEYVAARMMK